MKWEQLIITLISSLSGGISIYKFTEEKLARTSKHKKIEEFEIQQKIQSERQKKIFFDGVGILLSMLSIISVIFYNLVYFSNKQEFKILTLLVGYETLMLGCAALMAIYISSNIQKEILILSYKIERKS
jgi:Na+-translocating ferredoxin:NAD+ oxidoreductase RnfG subunit